MLEDFYKELDKLINEQTGMNSRPASPLEQVEGLIRPESNLSMFKTPCASPKKYSVDKKARILEYKDVKYEIPDFFNINSLINGDFKTIDYVFTYLHLDYG